MEKTLYFPVDFPVAVTSRTPQARENSGKEEAICLKAKGNSLVRNSLTLTDLLHKLNLRLRGGKLAQRTQESLLQAKLPLYKTKKHPTNN